MPDLKISQLPVAPFITDSALVAIVQAGVTQQITKEDLFLGVVGSAGGTINKYAKFTGTNTISDALLSDDGTNVKLPSGKFITSQNTTQIQVDFGTTGSEYFQVTTDGGGFAEGSIYMETSYGLDLLARPSHGISVDIGSNLLYLINDIDANSKIVLNSPIQNINGNLSLSAAASYASGEYTFLQQSGTAPAADIANSWQVYSADIVAGNAAPHFRTENSDVIKLYKYVNADFGNTINSGDVDTNDAISAIISALTAHGLIATS